MLIHGICLNHPDIISDIRGHRAVEFHVRGAEGRTHPVRADRQLGEFCRRFLSPGSRVVVLGVPVLGGVDAREVRCI